MKCFALTNIVLNDFCLKQICNDNKKKLKFMSTHKTCEKWLTHVLVQSDAFSTITV